MRPEYSLIILTVLAGAGQGLFVFVVTGDMAGFVKGSRVPASLTAWGVMGVFALTLLGMAASFFHLSHKARGIKAINKWRQSWLSREVVLLPIFLGAAGLYGLLAYAGAHPYLQQAVGLGGVTAAAALYISTAMIYAHLKFIREWGTAYTPANFTLTGLICGGAAALAVNLAGFSPMGAAMVNMRLLFAVILAGLVVKLLYYRRNLGLYSSSTIQTALGINHPVIRQMETGSAYPTYNTTEYHYTAARPRRGMIKLASILLLYFIPFILLAWDYNSILVNGVMSMAGAPAAALSALAGAFMERWLFFVEGSHVQNLYYGNFPLGAGANPILQPGKKDAPLPPA